MSGDSASEKIHDWNPRSVSALRPRTIGPVEVDDESMRDGLQSPSVQSPPTETRKRWLRWMAQLGIQRVNVGLPMSSQLPVIVELLELLSTESLPLRPGLAVRTDQGDVEGVARLRDKFPKLTQLRANMFLPASPIRLWVEKWPWQRVVDLVGDNVRRAVSHGIPVMLVTEDTTRTPPERISEIYGLAIDLGASEVCIADTCGHCVPEGAAAIVTFVRQMLAERGRSDVKINWHGHSDRGLALANGLAAIAAGVDVVHGSILGIGERSGNMPLDLMLVNLALSGDWQKPLPPLLDYVRSVSEATAMPIPHNYPVFGMDAFRTATGVHAAAIAKAHAAGSSDLADLVYSAVPASLVGRAQTIDIGPMSGRWNARHWLSTHGHTHPPESLVEGLVGFAHQVGMVLTESQIEEWVRVHAQP